MHTVHSPDGTTGLAFRSSHSGQTSGAPKNYLQLIERLTQILIKEGDL